MCNHCTVRERNSRIYSTLTVASKFATFESRGLQSVGICQEKMFTILISDPDEMKQQLGTEWAKVR